MELKDTIQGMTSDDFKERINAELQQLAIRINKAEKYLHSIKYEDKNANDYIMEKQLDAMKEYYRALWTRAKLFKIDTDETDRVLDVII